MKDKKMDVSDKSYLLGASATALANRHSDDIAAMDGWVEVKFRVNLETGEHCNLSIKELEQVDEGLDDKKVKVEKLFNKPSRSKEEERKARKEEEDVEDQH